MDRGEVNTEKCHTQNVSVLFINIIIIQVGFQLDQFLNFNLILQITRPLLELWFCNEEHIIFYVWMCPNIFCVYLKKT